LFLLDKGTVQYQVLHLTGCDLLTIGRHKEKLKILENRYIKTTINPDLNIKYDIVVDCTGQASGFELAQKILRPRGTLILKSTFHGGQDTTFAPFVINEFSIVGSRCGPFAPAIRLLEKKLVDVKPLISASLQIDKGLEAFEKAKEKGIIKVHITF